MFERQTQIMFTALAIAIFMHLTAYANNLSGVEFQSLYTLVIGWANGISGILGAIALLVVGIYLSFVGEIKFEGTV